MTTVESSSTKSNSNESINVKYETLEKGPTRKYNRKSKTNDKAKVLIDQMIKEQTIEQSVEQPSEQPIEQSSEQTISDLLNSEGCIEVRLEKQQEEYRLEKLQKQVEQVQNDKTQVDQLLDVLEPIFEQHYQEFQNKTISERVKNAMINTVNYTKIGQQEGQKKQVTGKLVDLTLVEDGDLCVIDFDINHELPKEKIDEIRQNIINSMLPINVGLVRTAHGGLHAYCNRSGYILPANRCVKCIILDNIQIDIFGQMFKNKHYADDPEQKELIQNRVVGPNSSFRETKNNKREILKYETINDQSNMTHLANLRDILDKWNVDIEISYIEYIEKKQKREFGQQITNDGIIDQMNDELAQACIARLKNLTIHNYPQAINMEVSLVSIFSGLFGITNESIRLQGINNIRQFNKLTANAEKNYGQAASNGEHEFTLLDMLEKAANGEYENEEQILKDLTRLLVYYEGETEDIYAIKGYDAISDMQVLYHKLERTIYKQLDKVIINYKNQKKDPENDNKKQLTAKHIFKKYASKFVKKGCKFISEDLKILTIFQGYKYKKLDTIDYECLQMYFDLIKDTIAAGDERVYEYIVNWIAWMIQNPGKKSRAAIILQGRQAIGKNRFTDVIAELTSLYSCPNITNIDEFIGRFNSVVENKMFAVLNEIMNYNGSKKGVATVMKSIISDLSIRINEKNQPRRTAENVMNVIYVTNADMPVQLDTDDRRHLVCACETVHQIIEKHKEDAEYFKELSQSYTQKFYENLMTFLLERDISQFNSAIIPMTEAKKQLMNGSRLPVDNIIMEHYEQFKQGIPVAFANQCKPQNWLLKTYKNALEHKCSTPRPYFNGVQTRVYVLNKDQQTYYDKMMNEEDIEVSNKNYQKYNKSIEDDRFVDQVVQSIKEE
ncbi:MAG: hypothetical protein EZS28_005793 [Streblomastix strix]|uniref:NrS-1 polymerase-like helicase domain-containing protein n=1 Tax=Streblomastix strix TaxID=222440 RepID=A0A5J4WWQ9_9EUKA|nr:MAG: hypothetical protein EZS28_005793 [Streblomastix strix]